MAAVLEGYKRPIRAQDFDRGVLEFTAASIIHGNGAREVDWDRLRALPCLVIGGQRDTIVAASACRRLADRLGCPYVEIPDAGHSPMEDHPDQVVAAVREWLRTTP
eukprot:TRINITY_DN8901_c0_g1_i1.p5 TRINITY_DN8901_c0_g1~~TRINITY_DN8901_c0_g1_i1.p5  ORF type:complete len:106 (-),score=31.78 TRINITY_DN8901_c0_g1_i1:254-571(-)